MSLAVLGLLYPATGLHSSNQRGLAVPGLATGARSTSGDLQCRLEVLDTEHSTLMERARFLVGTFVLDDDY